MTSLLVGLLISILSTISNAQDAINPVCLWGRYNQYDRYANGLYRHGGEVNDKPFYKLDRTGQGCEHDYLWMYFIDTPGVGEGDVGIGWHIGWGNNGIFGFAADGAARGTVAWCDNPTATNPWACGPNWNFKNPFTGNWVTDGNVTAIENACPILDCASITIPKYGTFNSECSSSDGSINLIPYQQIGDNMYTADKVGYSNRVWFFNEPEFQWQCINTDTHSVTTRCDNGNGFSLTNDGLINYASYQEWQDLSNGGSISISDVYGVGGCNNGDGGPCTATVQCDGAAKTTTLLPTTPNPTIPLIPTPQPTFKPITAFPTLSPSVEPTTVTMSPSPRPTVRPTTARPTEIEIYDGNDGNDDDNDWIIGKGPAGLDWLWWILIILLIICLCILCVLLIFKLLQKRKKDKQMVEMYGDNSGGSYQPDSNYGH